MTIKCIYDIRYRNIICLVIFLKDNNEKKSVFKWPQNDEV